MITKEQIQKVQDWGKAKNITDPIKQYVKTGEELSEMIGEIDVRKKYSEMGDYFFTLILLSGQIGFDFHTAYVTAGRTVTMGVDGMEKLLMLEHLALGGNLLKGKDASYHLMKCITLACAICNKIRCNESYYLNEIIKKNEAKAGKTVNGTFVKAEDLWDNWKESAKSF